MASPNRAAGNSNGSNNYLATPNVTSSTTTTAPVTTTTSVTFNNRRQRSNAANNSLRPVTPTNGTTEPFPELTPAASPAVPTTPGTRGPSDYFSNAATRYPARSGSIGIRRLPSSSNVNDTSLSRVRSLTGGRKRAGTGPRDRDSGPQAATAGLAGLPGHYEVGTQPGMETITEGQQLHQNDHEGGEQTDTNLGRSGSRLHRASQAARSIISKISDDHTEDTRRGGQNYEEDVVDYLDVLDPEVSTLTTLTNVQNTMFVPDIPFLNKYINRRPTYNLSRGPSRVTEERDDDTGAFLSRQVSRVPTRKPMPPTPSAPEVPPKSPRHLQHMRDTSGSEFEMDEGLSRRFSISSHVEESHYAVLPHGVTLEGWSQEEVDVLDDYVRHMLHSRRNRFKRSMKGFGKYVRKPLGFFVTLYAFLITAFGLIWVLFLIGWISGGAKRDYVIHIVDSVLVGLFAIMGDGLAPFRAIDTYHMIYIAHYHKLSWKLRKNKALPKLHDHNDLPERTAREVAADAEAGIDKDTDADWEFSVLTPEQQKKLVHHQSKFSKSHSYYRPHETSTHYAFPLKLLITIVVLCDMHSILQIMLGAFTWGWSYHTRPEWITAVILSFSITANISAGIIISIGDKRTRKKDVLLRMARQGLTEQAMRKMEKEKRDRDEETRHLKKSLDVARAANIKQGVSEPESGFESGVEDIQDKFRPYKNPGHSSSSSEDGHRSKSADRDKESRQRPSK